MSVQLERSSRNGDRVWSKSYVRKVMMAEPVKRRIVYGALLLLTVCFLLQVFSPLRLNTDAIVLLSLLSGYKSNRISCLPGSIKSISDSDG